MNGVLVVHGGAGFLRKDLHCGLVGVDSAARTGIDVIKKGNSALDAVESAVAVMEDNPIFNAGRGSSLTFRGTVEMDASIMNGRDLSAGAVALVSDVKNPVHLARIIMDKTDHVLVAGKTAEMLADEFSLAKCNPITQRRRKMYAELRKKLNTHPTKNTLLLREHDRMLCDTVGALAMDEEGDVAAAASTGGVMLKLPGRIGDTPQIGSGLYADNRSGAATATGLGEVAIRLVLSKTICMMMERGMSSGRASALAISSATKLLNGQAGAIAIDRQGRAAAVHNSRFMPWAYSTTKMRNPKTEPRGKIVAPLG